MVEWDRVVFPAELETDGDAHHCFRIFRTLFDEVTHQTIRELFTVRWNVMCVREQCSVERPTLVVSVPAPAMPSQEDELVPPGVTLEDLVFREFQPPSDGGRQMSRTVVRVPPVFVIELNRVDQDSGADEDGCYLVRVTQVLFPP
jgi:hypothetical protein